MTKNPLEAQIEAIVAAAVDKAVSDTTERLSTAFKTENKGLLANRDALLAENRRLKGKPEGTPPRRSHDRNGQPFDRFYTQEDEDRHLAIMAQNSSLSGQEDAGQALPTPTTRNGENEVFLDREAARDVQKYRAAKAAAEARGVPLRIVDNNGPAVAARPGMQSDLRSFDDPVHKVRYLRRDQIQGAPIRHRTAAERDGLKLVLFTSLDDLDENGMAAYREARGEP